MFHRRNDRARRFLLDRVVERSVLDAAGPVSPFGFTIKRQGRLRLRKPAHRVEWAVNGAEAMFHLLTAPSSECSAHIVCGTHCGCPFVHARGPTGCHWLRLKHDNVDACSVARSSALGQGAPMGPPWGCP